MDPHAIRAEHLAKRFRLGELVAYGSLRDLLMRPFRRPPASPFGPSRREIWALDDVSFELAPGEITGIVGRNGAGKTTLLKVLSRILRPTSGQAEVRGRVASLLEVGTGFHGELTGRENVFFNGAILGMRRREIKERYASIVEFAEMEQFMETPVKHYSSGMGVRLAFSVAAHLEADILLVDEVLAVGDAAFQKKCLGKMREVTGRGRTVLFVSHNLPVVLELCGRALWLDKGVLKADGPAADVLARYHASLQTEPAEVVWPFEQAPGDDTVKLRALRARNPRGEVAHDHPITETIDLEVEFWTLKPGLTIVPRLNVTTSLGSPVLSAWPFPGPSAPPLQPSTGLYRAACRIPENYLNAGTYQVGVTLFKDAHTALVKKPEALYFSVYAPAEAQQGFTSDWPGVVRPRLPWEWARVGDLP